MFYYRDADGNYVGAFDVPQDSNILCHPPEDGRQKWNEETGTWSPLPTPVIIVYAVDLWSRTDEEEATKIEESMELQPVRLRNIFKSASSYRSDSPLWPLLLGIATTLFGEARAKQLLAPSEQALV